MPPRPPTSGPLAAKLAALEQELQAFLKSEAERSANAARIVLTLELANLKRAIDRGERYADELARAKAGRRHAQPHAAGALHAGGRAGACRADEIVPPRPPTPCWMRKPSAADATLVDRLLSGARSIVRVRKAGHAADDTSAEAVVGRMETALKEGRLAEVLAKAKKLPPKAALAGEDWVKKVAGAPGRRPGAGRRRGGAQGLARRRPAAGTDGQAMIRIVLFLLAILAIAVGLHWLADRPGTIVVEWQGYVAETSVFRAFIMLLLLVGAILLVWSTLRWLWSSPALRRPHPPSAAGEARARCALERHHRHRRRRPGARRPLCRPGAQGPAATSR